jgi:hypothetical protein
MLREDLGGIFLSVVSHARPGNVEKMNSLVGEATWFVGHSDFDAYADAGAVVVTSGALCESRNAALELAFHSNALCVELSDDLTRIQVAVQGTNKLVAKDVPFKEAVALVLEGMRQTGAKLGGAAPTSNPFYANVERPVHPSAFIVGDFIAVAPCDLRFDEDMTLKEDYDYTLQHLMKYGTVARRNDVLMTFLHRKNVGGAVEVRTPELEQANIAMLKAKWPQFIADNPRRPDEILLKLPKLKRA